MWNGTLIYGTKRLTELVDVYFPPPRKSDNKLNPAFIEAVEKIFVENNVPWAEDPLLPIMLSGNAVASAPH